jgi:hypothetical protein
VWRELLFLRRRDLWTEYKGSRHPGLWTYAGCFVIELDLQITALLWETGSLQAWKGHHEASVNRTWRIVTFLSNNLERTGSLGVAISKSQQWECNCRGGRGSVPGQCVWDLSRTKWRWYRVLSRYFFFYFVSYHSANVKYSYPYTILCFKQSGEILVVFTAPFFCENQVVWFLCAFVELRRATFSFAMSLPRLLVRMEQTGLPLDEFSYGSGWVFFFESLLRKLKFNKSLAGITVTLNWRMYICDLIWLSS